MIIEPRRPDEEFTPRVGKLFIPTLPRKTPDQLFPIDFCKFKKKVPFHFVTWILSNFSSFDEVWDVLQPSYSPHEWGLPLVFRDRQIRDDFANWWKIYQKRFSDAGTSIVDEFVPNMPEGHISGAYVKHEIYLDSQRLLEKEIFNANADSLLTPWVWIVNNCKASVYRLHDGWFFTNSEDAALFKLFKPYENTIKWHTYI